MLSQPSLAGVGAGAELGNFQLVYELSLAQLVSCALFSIFSPGNRSVLWELGVHFNITVGEFMDIIDMERSEFYHNIR